jgi:hypothetical protein
MHAVAVRRDGVTPGEPPGRAGFDVQFMVIVNDARSELVVPGLDVRLTLSDDRGIVGRTPVPFLWDPSLWHYGRRFQLRRTGRYDATVDIGAAPFLRPFVPVGTGYERSARATFTGLSVRSAERQPTPVSAAPAAGSLAQLPRRRRPRSLSASARTWEEETA